MLYRKIAAYIEDYLKSDEEKVLILKGARQIGKSFIVNEVAKRIYKNVITINFVEDDEGDKVFKNVHKTEDFYLNISMIASDRMGTREDTLVFLDEIQHYPQYMTLLKFFKEEKRFRFIASGSLLGVALNSTTSIPVGSVIIKDMYQLDFEEFLIANNVGATFIADMREKFDAMEALSEENHQYIMNMFRRYLLVGGLPDAVNEYLRSHNIAKVREVQDSIRILYRADAIKYEEENRKKLMVQKIYDMIPSQMESVKKESYSRISETRKGTGMITIGMSLNILYLQGYHCQSMP